MSKPLLLRLHRWITLVFALPLLIVIFTGLILSFQPIVQTVSISPGSITLTQLNGLLEKYDPENKARGLSLDAFENSLSIDGIGEVGSVDVDLASGAEAEDDSVLSQVFSQSRRLHQRLISGLRWLVDVSTAAMLVIAGLGVAMGWPRIRNNLPDWHKAMAWFLLPLVVLSPVTGLLLAFNVTFNPAPSGGQGGRGAPGGGAPREQRVLLPTILGMVAEKHDLSSLVSIGNRGGRILARVNDSGVLRAYAVTPQGLAPTPTNWPRAIHEGNFAGVWSGLINVVTSVALLGLLGTGLVLWARRTFRRRATRDRVLDAAVGTRAA